MSIVSGARPVTRAPLTLPTIAGRRPAVRPGRWPEVQKQERTRLVHNNNKGSAMKRDNRLPIVTIAAVFGILGGTALYAQEKYSLKTPDGVEFSDFKGYE